MAAFYSVKPKVSTTTSVPRILKVIKPVEVVRGASIAHMKLTSEQGDAMAAAWVAGRVIVHPTIDLACSVFGTSYSSVIKMRGRRGNRPNTSFWLGLAAGGWENLSEAEHVAFAIKYEAELWHALEHLTDFHRD
jgi:hypothetical protein